MLVAVALFFAAVEPISKADADAAQAALAAAFEYEAEHDRIATTDQGGGVDVGAVDGLEIDEADAKAEAQAKAHNASDEPACRITGDNPAPIEEMALGLAHQSVTMHEGWAALTIEQKFLNVPRGPGARTWSVALPEGAGVVVGAAMGEDEAPPHPVRLDDAVIASTLFDEYKRALEMGVPLEEAKQGAHGAAVLVSQSEGTGGVVVDVAAPCSVRIVTVRIEARIATLPKDGGWTFQVPRFASDFQIDAPFPIRARVDESALHTKSAMGFDDDAERPFADVTVTPLTGARLRTRGYASIVSPTGEPQYDADVPAKPLPEGMEDMIVARAELDLPKPLSEAPAALRLVFVMDASVSVGAAALVKEWQTLDAILDAAPVDAKYAVVTMGRKPKTVVSPWRERADRARPVVELSNGSDAIAAMKRARGIAADAGDVDGKAAVVRIVVLSDMQLKDADDDAALVRSFVDAPLTHVVVTSEWADAEDETTWMRSFGTDDPRAKGPESTGGIWVETGAGVEGEATLYPHLIRPTRVDLPSVTLAGVSLLGDQAVAKIARKSPVDLDTTEMSDEGVPVFLVEGSGLRVEAALNVKDADGKKRAARDLRIGGFLWATPLDERITKDDRDLAAFAAVDEVGTAIGDEYIRTIATREHAVSRVTSFVEVPVWRPATTMLLGASGCGCGCGGCSCCCGCSGCTGVGTAGTPAELHEQETLEQLLAADARACLVPLASAKIEIGDLEILDVAVTAGGACVAERIWSHRLDLLADKAPGAFHAHRTFEVSAGPAAAAVADGGETR